MMATGYTYPIADGTLTTLREFALLCARGMGACIMMRDEPLDAPIPERFEPSTKYHDERLAEARKLFKELSGLSADERDLRAVQEYDASLASWRKYEDERDRENRRLRDMIATVEAWETKAEGIKEFMLQQLGISVSDYHSPRPTKRTGEEWLTIAQEKAAHDIEYHEAERAKEITRTEDRNRWLADLRASLPAA